MFELKLSLLCSVLLFFVLHFEHSQAASSTTSSKQLKCRDKCLTKDGFFEDNNGFIKAVSRAREGWFRTLGGRRCSCGSSSDFKTFLRNKFGKEAVSSYKWSKRLGQGEKARAKMSGVTFHTDAERILGVVNAKRKAYDEAHPGQDNDWDSKPVTSICDGSGCRLLKASDLKA